MRFLRRIIRATVAPDPTSFPTSRWCFEPVSQKEKFQLQTRRTRKSTKNNEGIQNGPKPFICFSSCPSCLCVERLGSASVLPRTLVDRRGARADQVQRILLRLIGAMAQDYQNHHRQNG